MSAYAERRGGENRLFLSFLLLVSIFIFMVYRLVVIQILEAPQYSQLALNQRLRYIELAPHRGTIYDRNGKELALSVSRDTIYATPYFIKNPQEVAKKLSSILGFSEDDLYQKFTKKSGFVYLLRKAEPEVAREVKKLDIEGIGFLKESKRVYPCSSLGSQVIGFVGMDNEGLMGLELYYDEVLKGEAGKLLAERDPSGRIIPGSFIEYSHPSDGKSIHLTIDREIQHKAEVELKKKIEEWQAKGGSVVVMSPKTGEIFALANYPCVDPNNFTKEEEAAFRNCAVADAYELGSIMKTIVAAAALEEKICAPETVFHLPETIKVADKVIKEAHPRPAKNFTFTEIITESSNVGIVTIGQKLGKETIYKYLLNFGLTDKT
ncbi:MAG: penicillin-binding protein 2, partial [Candidatus Subteraquimicrobiales bacterium]|nr:penicillin-binding protein 2 [Candidatus Subteraquimicrobiales bacterium]